MNNQTAATTTTATTTNNADAQNECNTEQTPKKNLKKKIASQTARCMRCIHCKTFVKIDKRTKNYYGLQENPICDICSVQIEQYSKEDYLDIYFDRDVELEIELLKNPSGRAFPKLYEEDE